MQLIAVLLRSVQLHKNILITPRNTPIFSAHNILLYRTIQYYMCTVKSNEHRALYGLRHTQDDSIYTGFSMINLDALNPCEKYDFTCKGIIRKNIKFVKSNNSSAVITQTFMYYNPSLECCVHNGRSLVMPLEYYNKMVYSTNSDFDKYFGF